METCNELTKKPRRSFVKAWLDDERYKYWIREVSSNAFAYHCIICNKNFSCDAAHVSRHANSARHRNNLKKPSISDNDNVKQNNNNIQSKTSKLIFRKEWLDIKDFKLWLREVPYDKNVCSCVICNKSFAAHLSHIRRHEKSRKHLNLCIKKDIEASESNCNFNIQDDESLLSFSGRKKSAEIRYAALIAEKDISHQTAQEILNFFQRIGRDVNVLKSMSIDRTKCRNMILRQFSK